MNDEFEWIKGITPNRIFHKSILKKGIGDDAAVYEGNSEFDEIVCVDTMVEEVHFSRKTMEPYHIGFKALATNLSDIAAMGGKPLFYLVSIAISNDWSEDDLKEIYKGMESLAAKYHVDLIGGDTVSTKYSLVITVTVLGRAKKGHYVLRETAKPGDIVFVTGKVGESACGLSLLLDKGLDANFTADEKTLIKAHQMPNPQVEAGQLLGESELRLSLNDISDGIASEANEIAEASRVQLVIDYNKLPIGNYIQNYPVTDQFKWTLFGGEDYQLIGTIGEEDWPSIQQLFNDKGIPLIPVGSVQSGKPEVFLQYEGKQIVLEKKGYNHFKK